MRSYPTEPTAQTLEFVIGASHQLWRIEQNLRLSNHQLQVRPIYHDTRESLEAHLTNVFAALSVTL